MEKCMYKCSDGMCACSISPHHCKQVDDEDCLLCLSNQEKPTVSDKVKLKRIIEKAIELMENDKVDNTNNYDALLILQEAMKI